MKKFKILVSLACMLGVFSFANASAMEKKKTKKTEFNTEKDLFKNNLNEEKKEYEQEDKKEENKEDEKEDKKEENKEDEKEDEKEKTLDEIDTSSKKKETENKLKAQKQKVRKEYRSVIPGDVQMTGFKQGKEFESPNAEIDFIFDFKKTELDLVEEDGIDYNKDAYSFANLIREVELIFGAIPTFYSHFDDGKSAQKEAYISKFLKRLKEQGIYDVFQKPARKKFEEENIKYLAPVLAEYINYQMDKYKHLNGQHVEYTDGEYILLKKIRKFILLSNPPLLEYATSSDWKRFEETGRFDGEFESRFIFKLRDDTKKSFSKQLALGSIKSVYENFIKPQGKNFRQTIAYRVLFAFFYVVMRENLNLTIDKHFKIDRTAYFEKKQEELMKEIPMEIERYSFLEEEEENERNKRLKALPKVRCCIDIDPELYGIDFNSIIEKKGEPFEWLKWFTQDKEDKESEDDSDFIYNYQVGNEGNIAKKHMELNKNRIIKEAAKRVKYNGTPKDFDTFYTIAYYKLNEKPIQGKFKYLDKLFCPPNIKSFRFSEDGLNIILKFRRGVYEENIYRILDFNHFVNSSNYVIGVGKTSSYAERIAEIALLYKKLCEKKKEYDIRFKKLEGALSKYNNNGGIIIESVDGKEEENKNKKDKSVDEEEESEDLFADLYTDEENSEDSNEINTSSNKK